MPELYIGGFRFALHSEHPVAAVPANSPYAAFTKPCPEDFPFDGSVVDVRLNPLGTLRRMPAESLFAGPTWSMYSDGDLRRIVMRDRENPEPFWVAEFTLNGRRADVYYGPRQLNAAGEVVSPLSYPLDQLLMMYLLAETGGVLLHAAGGIRNGGEVFAGPSGAGKTTMTRMLLAEGFEMFSDDRIIVRPRGESLLLFGTPWPGDAKVAASRCAELARVHILQKAGCNRDVALTPADALAKVIPCCSLPWFDKPVLAKSLEGLARMLERVPHSVCHFTKKTPE